MFQAVIFVKSRRSVYMINEFIIKTCMDGCCKIVLNGYLGRALVEFQNGSLISINAAGLYNMRGKRYNVALIENEVSKEIVFDCIAPYVILQYPGVTLRGIIWI